MKTDLNKPVLEEFMQRVRWAIVAVVAVFVIWAVIGCTSTVIPKTVHATQPAFEGNVSNSGFLGFNKDGSGRITLAARVRYNSLIQLYGNRFTPPVQADAGITATADSTVYTLNGEGIVRFMTMSRWRREGK